MENSKVLKELLGKAKKIMKDIVENTTDPVEDKEEPGRISCGYCGRDLTGDETLCPSDDCVGTQIKEWLNKANKIIR